MNDQNPKLRNWSMCLLVLVTGFVLLGPQNRFYRANDNWIYTGKGDYVVVGAIAVLLLVSWGLLAIKKSKALVTPHLYIDGLVIVVVLSCAVSRLTIVSAIYLVALLFGIVVCKLVAHLDLSLRQIALLLYCIIGFTAIVALTNLIRFQFGWTLAFTEPPKWYRYASIERASLWFGNPNDLGCVIAMSVVLVVWLLERAKNWFYRTISIALLCVFLKVLLDTYSRGAIVGLFVGLMVYLAYGMRNSRRFVSVVGVILVIVSCCICTSRYSDRLKSVVDINSDGSIFLRLLVWRDCLAMIREHPLIGVGLGNFALAFETLEHGHGYLEYSAAMNNLLTLGVESGVVSPLLYLGGLASAVKASFSKSCGIEDRRHVFVAALCVLVVCGLFTYNLCRVYYCVSWLILGLIIRPLPFVVAGDVTS